MTMKVTFLWSFACWGGFIVLGQKTSLDNGLFVQIFRTIKEAGFRINDPESIGSTSAEGSRQLHEAKRQGRAQNRIPDRVAFPCDVSNGRSNHVPTSVHKLRPGDIDVIGAIGDSLTAGTGALATNMLQLVTENRGVTALGGGKGTWRDYFTVPNIIKEFNPNLVGYSAVNSLSHQKGSQLNVAEPGAMSRDLPHMARNLVTRMEHHPGVKVKKHWKLISIFIGYNDFCSDICWISTGPRSILVNHRDELIKTLRILKQNLPRTLVSLVSPPSLMFLTTFKDRSPACGIAMNFLCTCLLGLGWQAQRNEFEDIMFRWQTIDEEVALHPEFQTDDFAVVVQPFATNLTFPVKPNRGIDYRYLSMDCFHLSQVANARMAVAVWKNMLEPIGEKSRDWEDYKGLKCPTKSRPYIATAANSQRAWNNIIEAT